MPNLKEYQDFPILSSIQGNDIHDRLYELVRKDGGQEELNKILKLGDKWWYQRDREENLLLDAADLVKDRIDRRKHEEMLLPGRKRRKTETASQKKRKKRKARSKARSKARR